ncbi:NAD-dependent epimerase/dehydratase family protein [Lentzea guizhouensis]|uniref:NAD-dependent epimerase/dehydratase family protein n=1 Tax=Lentzea guizhouensis TaxID=1586287 RepID=UPI001F027A6F|nr:NAD-dependent epimerase/dehydratase family protein [Lentzea guizhouensis]
MERVLITGGAGFIGRHLAARLLQAGSEVVVVDDLRVTPLLGTVGELRAKAVLEMDPGDLRGVDVVYHLASHKNVPESFDRPLDYLDNVDSGRHLLDLCERAGVPKVFVGSTCEVYGAAHLPNREDMALSPRSPYASSKVALEMIARSHQQLPRSITEVTVVRFFNVYGPGERPDAVVPALCRSAIRDGRLPIEGTGAQRRDFSYVDDTVERLVRLAAVPTGASGGTINVGSGRSHTVSALARLIQSIKPGVEIEHRPRRRNEIAEFLASTLHQDEVLGPVAEPTAFADGVRRTYDWWLERLSADVDARELAGQEAGR